MNSSLNGIVLERMAKNRAKEKLTIKLAKPINQVRATCISFKSIKNFIKNESKLSQCMTYHWDCSFFFTLYCLYKYKISRLMYSIINAQPIQ